MSIDSYSAPPFDIQLSDPRKGLDMTTYKVNVVNINARFAYLEEDYKVSNRLSHLEVAEHVMDYLVENHEQGEKIKRDVKLKDNGGVEVRLTRNWEYHF